MAEQTKSRALLCPHCDTPTVGEIVGVALWGGQDPSGNTIDPPTEWALVQCQRCWQPVLQRREDYGPGFDDDTLTVAYPSPRRLSYSIPAGLRNNWEEARVCFHAKAYMACVVMIRRTLEGLCREHGVMAQNLAPALTALREQGVIDAMLEEWANALRVLGNEGAHYSGRAVGREDAADALDFAEAVLDHVYVFRARFNQFKDRRRNGATE